MTRDKGDEWGHQVRELPDDERLGQPRRCSVDGCWEPATHEARYTYKTWTTGREWVRRLPYCPDGAREFARLHQLTIGALP